MGTHPGRRRAGQRAAPSALPPGIPGRAPRPRRSAPSTASRCRDSLDEILADPEIDAVVFATPHSEHGRQVEAAAAAGKHVFMEKPFTLDRNSAARALDAVARAGIVLGVAYPRRFHPSMRELKARIDDGRLGTLAHCSAEQNGPAGLFMDPASWRAARERGAGRRDDRDGRPQSGRDDPSVRPDRRGLCEEPQARDLLRRPGHDERHVRFRERHVGKSAVVLGDGGHLPARGVRHKGLR